MRMSRHALVTIAALATACSRARARPTPVAPRPRTTDPPAPPRGPPGGSAPIEVTVRAGLVTSATLEDGTAAPEGAALTIHALLDGIASALNEPVASAVAYHEDLGYPLEVQLDLEPITVDGGLSLTVTAFERLD